MGRLIILSAISLALLWAGGAQASPKNVILMIGDGTGFDQVAAGRLLAPLVMDQVDPSPGSVNTSNVYGGITDSAASATAYATGFKTANGNISMLEDDLTILPTNMQAAIAEGMATGILSDVYMCDATPGVWVAHAPRRSCSVIIPQQVEACVDVFLGAAKAYVQPGRNGFDYIEEMAEKCGHQRVKSARELARAQAPNDRLAGVWGGYTLTYDIDRQNDPGGDKVPTLAEMTAKAIEVLSRDEDGFMLVVEAGGIDWMAHNKDIAGVARGVLAFDAAVAEAYDFAMTDGDTLLIVTADHETGGLLLGDSPNVAFIESITASTDFMYGLILRGEASIEDVLETYAGVTDLTQAEKDAIEAYGETAISDALSLRANVQWILPNGEVSVAPEEGDHTLTEVPVRAFGPGSEALEGSIDNTEIGAALFDVVTGN
jgi:alkaline phosphatase